MKGQRGAQEKGDPLYVHNSENMNHPNTTGKKKAYPKKSGNKKSNGKKY